MLCFINHRPASAFAEDHRWERAASQELAQRVCVERLRRRTSSCGRRGLPRRSLARQTPIGQLGDGPHARGSFSSTTQGLLAGALSRMPPPLRGGKLLVPHPLLGDPISCL